MVFSIVFQGSMFTRILSPGLSGLSPGSQPKIQFASNDADSMCDPFLFDGLQTNFPSSIQTFPNKKRYFTFSRGKGSFSIPITAPSFDLPIMVLNTGQTHSINPI